MALPRLPKLESSMWHGFDMQNVLNRNAAQWQVNIANAVEPQAAMAGIGQGDGW